MFTPVGLKKLERMTALSDAVLYVQPFRDNVNLALDEEMDGRAEMTYHRTLHHCDRKLEHTKKCS